MMEPFSNTEEERRAFETAYARYCGWVPDNADYEADIKKHFQRSVKGYYLNDFFERLFGVWLLAKQDFISKNQNSAYLAENNVLPANTEEL